MRKNLIINKLWLVGIIFFLVLNPAFSVTIPEISAALSRDRIPIGETALLTVAASWTGEDSKFIFLKPQPPECRGLEVIGTYQRSIAVRTNGDLHSTMEYLFTLRGEKEGNARIGKISLSYSRPDEETEHSLTSRPIKAVVTSGEVGLFSSGGSVFVIIGIGIILIIIIALYSRRAIQRYRKKSNEVIADYVKNLEADSLKELDHVRKYKIRGEIGKYLEKIWDILADFLEKKYTITISPETWNKVIGGTQSSDLSEEAERELSGILKTLEESRFGSYQPDNQELDTLLRRVYSFIESQK